MVSREYLDAADELVYQVQQELSALINVLRTADLQAMDKEKGM